MENLGTLAILLAFCFACYAVIGSVAGKLGRRPFLILKVANPVRYTKVAEVYDRIDA